MSDQTYNEPHITLRRIYTKGGDKGETSLVNGRRLPKDDVKIEAYGTVDELNSFVGQTRVSLQELAAACPSLGRLDEILLRVQHELFNAGSILATDAGKAHPKQPRVTSRDIEQLEREIDDMNEGLGALTSFVLPGGSRVNTELHICRTVCRRAERLVVGLSRKEETPQEVTRYLNRLSDAFFVWSRWVMAQLELPEVLWEPNRAASGEEAEPQA